MVLPGGKNLHLPSISQVLGRTKRGRPALLLLALGLLTALVLSACGSSGGSSSSGGSETGGVETPITKEFVNLGPTVFAG
jgi:hypothetical protein